MTASKPRSLASPGLPALGLLALGAALVATVAFADTPRREGSKIPQNADSAPRVQSNDSGRSSHGSSGSSSRPSSSSSASSSSRPSGNHGSHDHGSASPGRERSKIPSRGEVGPRHGGGGHHGGHGGHGGYGHGGHRHGGRGYYPYRWRYDPFYSPYYYPYYSYPYSSWLYWGWGPAYSGWYGRPRVAAPYPTTYREDGPGALDFDVVPERAEIFVNGEAVGSADDYDGFPTYLWLEAGTYDVSLYASGFQTLSRQYTVYPGQIIPVEDRLEPGDAVRPEDLGPTSHERRDDRLERDAQRREDAERWEAAQETRRESPPTDSEVGRLHLRVYPPDAAVYLDGHFVGTGAEVGSLSAGLVVEPGEHRVEAVRPGYETEERDVDVDEGDTVELELDLTRP